MKNLTITKQVTMIDSNATGAMFRKLRKEKKLPLEVVAHKSRLTTMQLSRLERGIANWTPVIANGVHKVLMKP